MKNQYKQPEPAEYITPLCINGLCGRMLHMPAPKKYNREILFVYGHHSSLERCWGVIQDLNQYGSITVPDLPGFGGMDSFYKIGKQPTIDNLADYLAAFIKLRYKRKRITIGGVSFGFVVVTRMLQRYPELAKKVDLLVSIVGFTHRDDFKFSRNRRRFFQYIAAFFSYQTPAFSYKAIFRGPVIRLLYVHSHFAKEKFATPSREDRRRFMDFEVKLWRDNDMRTHWKTTHEFLVLDNCRQQVDLPVWNVVIDNDRYFDRHMIEQHMKVAFREYHEATSKMAHHAPSLIASKEEAAELIPNELRRVLSKP
jgi:pimeloyl-ACP methyl ester carboxylesterase